MISHGLETRDNMIENVYCLSLERNITICFILLMVIRFTYYYVNKRNSQPKWFMAIK